MRDFFWFIITNLYKLRTFPNLNSVYKELVLEERMTADEWKNLRDNRVSKLLTYACQKVPYYRNLIQKLDLPSESLTTDSLKKFPLLTKDIIKENINELISEEKDKNLLFENATGGSTGVPLKFYQDLYYQTVSNALDAYVRKWWGIRPHDKTAQIWGADREFGELSFREKLYSSLFRIKDLNAFRMHEESLKRFCYELEKWQPPYLMGYSSALEEMAKCAIINDIKIKFKAIRSTAETLWPYQREQIEKAFNCPVYNFYGSREINNLAAECSSQKKLHLVSTMRYVEIVDDKGNPLPDGEEGHIAVTDLSNFSMPFIRYLNGDYGKLSDTPCNCGLPSPYIEKLMGRSSDLIKTEKGDIIHGEFFTHLFYGEDSIKQFQIHQKTLMELKISIVVSQGKGLNNDFVENLKRRIHDRMGEKTNIVMEFCDEIPVPLSGKHRFTISDI